MDMLTQYEADEQGGKVSIKRGPKVQKTYFVCISFVIIQTFLSSFLAFCVHFIYYKTILFVIKQYFLLILVVQYITFSSFIIFG